MEIRQIKPEEIPLVKDFPPPDWQLDIPVVCNYYSGEPYFYFAIALVNNTVAGTGMAFMNTDTAWLGAIIVKETFRRQGIGYRITSHLVDRSRSSGCRNVLLVATDMGSSVYEKLGFKISSYYLVYKNGRMPDNDSGNSIMKMNLNDLEEVISIDKKVSGEDRGKIIRKTLMTGYKHVSENTISGYYLPDFGHGLIIATDETAGEELLKFRYARDKSRVAIPESNKPAIRFLEENGFKEYARYPRMYLGDEVSWQPEMIYSRGSGYLG